MICVSGNVHYSISLELFSNQEMLDFFFSQLVKQYIDLQWTQMNSIRSFIGQLVCALLLVFDSGLLH